MYLKSLSAVLLVAFCLAGCGNEGESMGHGPGNADGTGGRSDPPEATTNEAPNAASTVDPDGAMTTPDGSTEDTGATPRDPTPANH
jgi:hypothetical protein